VAGRQPFAIDWELEILETKGNLNLTLEYSDKLYDKSIIEGMLDQLSNTINKIKEVSDKTLLSEVMFLSEEQKKKVLEYSTGKRTDTYKGKTIIDLFREQAKRTPTKTALVYKDKKYSYEKLNKITDSFAVHLIEKGIKKGDRVGILLKHSDRTVISALAVMKSGASYVSLDLNHPPKRLAYMVKNSNPKAIIAEEKVSFAYKGSFISYQEDIRCLHHPEREIKNPSPNDDCVVFYTSGTTGNPKGVVIKHFNLANFSGWFKDHYKLSEKDNVGAYANFSFDASLQDIFPTLICGACLYVIPTEIRLDLSMIDEFFKEKNISIVDMTTALGRKYVEFFLGSTLKVLTVGGEALSSINPPAEYKLYNTYGPTECTVFVSSFEVKKKYINTPIGKPIDNTDIYILDRNTDLCPIGVYGEICIAGRQVSSGYFKEKELTAKNFIKNEFNKDKDYSVIYKTGDIARYLPDGNIEFIGRKDSQVKISGFRIELSEIETAIKNVGDVKEVVLSCDEAEQGSKNIVAYIVCKGKLNKSELLFNLNSVLPPYMIPTTFIQIDKIPLTSNGKTDYKALPNPRNIKEKRNIINPRNEIEGRIRKIWSVILGIETNSISVTDNFFDLGGTSIRAVALSLKMKNIFSVYISPAKIFETPTLEQIAQILLEETNFPMMHSFSKSGKSSPIYFVHTANTGAETYFPLAEKLSKKISFFGIEPYNLFTKGPMIRGISNLSRKYIDFLKQHCPKGPYILGGWSFGGVVAFEMAIQLESMGDRVEKLYLIDPQFSYSEKYKKLESELRRTSYMESYLKNDVLFKNFREGALSNRLLENNNAIMEDIYDYYPSKKFTGETILFKSTKKIAVPKDIDKDIKDLFISFLDSNIDSEDNGLRKYVDNLEIIKIDEVHDRMLMGESLEIIAKTIEEKILNENVKQANQQ